VEAGGGEEVSVAVEAGEEGEEGAGVAVEEVARAFQEACVMPHVATESAFVPDELARGGEAGGGGELVGEGVEVVPLAGEVHLADVGMDAGVVDFVVVVDEVHLPIDYLPYAEASVTEVLERVDEEVEVVECMEGDGAVEEVALGTVEHPVDAMAKEGMEGAVQLDVDAVYQIAFVEPFGLLGLLAVGYIPDQMFCLVVIFGVKQDVNITSRTEVWLWIVFGSLLAFDNVMTYAVVCKKLADAALQRVDLSIATNDGNQYRDGSRLVKIS